MNAALLEKLSAITEEERRILAGQTQIDRSLYMDGTRDVISGDKLLPQGKSITIRSAIPLWVHTDGEVTCKSSEITIDVFPHKLQLLI